MIEKGRYLNIPHGQQLCNACDEIEDKLHFLDKCINYNQIRLQFLNTIRVKLASNITRPSDVFLFNDMQNILVKFVFECNNFIAETSRRNRNYYVSSHPMGFYDNKCSCSLLEEQD